MYAETETRKYPKTPPNNFCTPHRQRDVFEACKAAAEYSLSGDVAAVAFVDRAARPMWVGFKEYWQSHTAKECPALFFLDPDGFWRARQEQTAPEKVQKELPRLYELKNETILVIDSCVHSGNTINPVLDVLRKAGFSDVRLGVVHDDSNKSGLTPNLVMLNHRSGCHPFTTFGSVTKHDGKHLFAEALEHSSVQIEDSIALRKQIREIIKRFTREEDRIQKYLGNTACR